MDPQAKHKKQLTHLAASLLGNTQPLRVKKRSISNLFRYKGRQKHNRREIDLRDFNKPLHLDIRNKTLDVQGLTTMETIVNCTLSQGFLPLITPELKHITIGGAIVGIGIESNTYRYGFVHDSLLEADVLLPDGKIVTCTPSNEYADLFYGLANSYGTLGYILRAKIKLRKVLPYITLETKAFSNLTALERALKKAAADKNISGIESLLYTKNKLFLTLCRETRTAKQLKSIYGKTIFYKEISKPGQFSLSVKDFTFRYDPEWFWNIPETKFFTIFRKLAPKTIRNSAFYSRYSQMEVRLPFWEDAKNDRQLEHLIQDWEVPWKHAHALLTFVLDTVDLNSKPLVIVLVKVPKSATCYPLKPNSLYLNLGSYSFVKKKPNEQEFAATKAIDDFCFKHDGIKMLYSTTFTNKVTFEKIYNIHAYTKLKQKYDPQRLTPTLYEKAVLAR
jgi:FAD/FMN-containing dehydrogenase